jgi:gamma-glutamylcyclotransferase (GGCT)/AIG2-like uncharacterized protein YtfP
MTDLLFVYGTLLPGQQRWTYLQPNVVDEGVVASVKGALYDTGHGYPAAVFWEFSTVHGRVFHLLPERAEQTLIDLDHVERTADAFYARVRVDTDAGQAWAYEYGGPLSFQAISGGSWLDHIADRQPPPISS